MASASGSGALLSSAKRVRVRRAVFSVVRANLRTPFASLRFREEGLGTSCQLIVGRHHVAPSMYRRGMGDDTQDPSDLRAEFA